jgi:hypothetical protein
VLYPVAAINSARQMATSFSSSFLSFRQLGSMNIASAQLPYPQQLEHQMLSADPNNIGTIGSAYLTVSLVKSSFGWPKKDQPSLV